jgi:hypothetical protein
VKLAQVAAFAFFDEGGDAAALTGIHGHGVRASSALATFSKPPHGGLFTTRERVNDDEDFALVNCMRSQRAGRIWGSERLFIE